MTDQTSNLPVTALSDRAASRPRRAARKARAGIRGVCAKKKKGGKGAKRGRSASPVAKASSESEAESESEADRGKVQMHLNCMLNNSDGGLTGDDERTEYDAKIEKLELQVAVLEVC